jgi:hypothetical protein
MTINPVTQETRINPVLLPLILLDVLGSAIRGAAADPAVPLAPRDVAVLQQDLAARVKSDPRFQDVADHVAHATNAEPWYQSRVTWGAIVAGAASVASALGLTLGPEERDLAVGVLASAGGLFGAVLTLYGRWIARRPLGTWR